MKEYEISYKGTGMYGAPINGQIQIVAKTQIEAIKRVMKALGVIQLTTLKMKQITKELPQIDASANVQKAPSQTGYVELPMPKIKPKKSIL